jgi:tRNA pseudouridine55 synthase
MLGALIIDKPAGLTSHDVVARARHLLHERRIGHTGTLDPFATGVLVLLVGPATRLAQFLSGLEKEYEAVIRLGFATDTGDITGHSLASTATATAGVKFDAQQIEAALATLRGDIDQVPPMFSAKKQQGKKLYELARRGEEVEREPVRISVHEFEAINEAGTLLKDNLDGTADLKIRVVCSAGTYVRTLAEDFGKQLGVGAHLAELRRTRVGHFHLENAVTLEHLQQVLAESALGKILVLPQDALSHLAKFEMSAAGVQKIRNGVALQAKESQWSDGDLVRLCDERGHLVAVANFAGEQNMLRPRVVLPQQEL